MAKRPSLFPSPWLSTLLFTTAALAYNLPTDISNFIPSCAEECFISFLYVSYGTTRCANDPTLQCLCSRVGATGFTLGEGALQCIIAERSIGFCSDIDASDTVIYNAYGMCDDQLNAVEPTHKTITATLVIPPTGGIITFPPAKTTTSTTSTSFTTLPTTLVIETSSPPPVPTTRFTSTSRTTFSRRTTSRTSTTLTSDTMITLRPTTISTSSTATESTTETSTSTGVAAGGGDGKGDDDGDDDNSLSRDQVAGISVGVLAAAGLAIGAILLARYYRHKKYPGMKTGFLPMRDTWGYKPSQSDSNKTNSWVAHQMPPPLDGFVQPPAPAYNRASYKPSAIGLALSPAQSRTTTQTLSPLRRISRLLPAKPVLPVLPLNISKRKSAPPPQDEWPGPQHYGGESRRDNIPRLPPLQITPSASLASMASPGRSRLPPPAPPKLQIPNPEGNNPMAPPSSHYQRESTMTEFEDDERASMSASAQVWRPPATPLSAATYYVADQYGNWVLGNAKNASQAPESQAAIPKPPPKDNANAPPAGILKVKNQDYVSPLSSDDSKTSLAPPAEIVSARWQASEAAQRPMGPRAQPYPNPLFSAAQSNPRRNSSNRRSLTRSLTRPRATSGSSDVTTITTSSEESSLDPTPPLEQQVNLSPVAESPHSSGRSPVAYPKIPTRDPKRISRVMNQNLNKRTAPPPTRPMVYYPPGQPSPTLGTMQPPSGPGMASNSAPKAGRKPAVNPGLPRSGSPTMRIVEPSPEPEEGAEEEQQRPAPPPKTRAPPFYFAPPYPQPLKSGLTSNPRGSAPGSGQPPTRPYRPYQPQQQQQQVSQRSYQNPLEEQQQQQLPQRSYQNPQQEQQQQPQRPYRIPQQQQHPLHHPYQQHQQQPQHQLHDNHHQWHPLQPPRKTNPDYNPSFGSDHSSSSSSLLAKRVGSDRAANMTIPTDPSRAKWRREDVSSQEASTPGRELPSTPTWLPRLTPTRRGQDLFLNVQ